VRRRPSSGRQAPIDSVPWWGNAAGIVLLVLLVLIVLSPFAYFLAPGFVNGKSLANSVVHKSGGDTFGSSCKRVHKQSDVWDCGVQDASYSATSYRVTSKGWGCWDGVRTGARKSDEGEWPSQISGCVKIGDNVRLFDRIFGDGSPGAD
jgi:hypothetical protein